jgi:hypothetical protein
LTPNSGKPELGGEGSQPDTEAVRWAYEKTDEPVISIRWRFGLSEHEFLAMRVGGGWASRPAGPRPGAPRTARTTGLEVLDYLADRVLAVAIQKTAARVEEAGLDEAGARMVTELCRAVDIRKNGMRKEKARTARETKKHESGRTPADDDAFIRAELKRRIERLRERDMARGGRTSAE